MPKPSVGRVVHYFMSEDERINTASTERGPAAAVITRVEGDQVDLTVFPCGTTVLTARRRVPQAARLSSDGQHWAWPPRL